MRKELIFILTAAVLLSFPNAICSRVPDLGKASGFSVFTSAGSIDNVGESDIFGDIGTNTGEFTGFSSGTIAGEFHVEDTISAQAAIDVEDAYNYLTSLAYDSVISTLLGDSQVLGPKVYSIDSAATLNGDLILDGENDPDGVFIFQINGDFSVSASSNVHLINSATLDNVYWQVNGKFDMGDDAVLKGNVIANGQISFVEGSSLLGRALTRQGAISLNNNRVDFRPPGGGALPVELLSFQADCKNQNVIVAWCTALEINNDYYSVERSTDATSWQTIGRVKGAGNSSTRRNYSFTDIAPYKGVSYYRIGQTDYDGASKRFNIAAVKNSSEDFHELEIYPNPAKGIFNLLLKGDKEDVCSISVYNLRGKEICSSEGGLSSIDLSNQNEGIYFIHYNLSGKIIVKKLILKK